MCLLHSLQNSRSHILIAITDYSRFKDGNFDEHELKLCDLFKKCIQSKKIEAFSNKHFFKCANGDLLQDNRLAIKPFIEKKFRLTLIRVFG
jgi:hypothetical protein